MPTIKEIAEKAGVSTGTVSNVLNGLSTVRESARARVMETIEQLGYQPSMLGRALRKDKTSMIVMIVPDITNPFFPAAVRGAEDIAFQNGFRLVLCNSDNNLAKEVTYIREMHSYRPSGLIVVPADLSKGTEEVRSYVRAGAGVTYVDRVPEKWRGDSVTGNHEEGAFAATRHLIELGHRRIATITGPLSATSAASRLAGYRRAMRFAGLSIHRDYIQEGDFSKTAGQTLTTILLRSVSRPTAIFAANDLIAFGALAAIREAKLECPGDVSVVGFDNLEECNATIPSLTTVDQFAYQLGAKAAQTVMDRVRGKTGQAQHVVLSPELRIRESTSPPRGTLVQTSSKGTRRLKSRY